MSARSLMAWFALWMALLAIAFYTLPGWHMVTWSALALASTAAMVMGIRRNRPRHRLPWYLLAAALLALAAGDTAYNLIVLLTGEQNPFPSVADGFYLAQITLQTAGMVGLARAASQSQDRASLLDSLTLTAGIGLLSWIYLINPLITDPDLTGLEKIISVVYPLSDVLLLATIAQLVAVARRSPTVLLLTIGGAGLLIADVLYGLGQLSGAWRVGGPVDLGWMVLYWSWGTAALHPSMTGLTEPRAPRERDVTTRRLVVLALSSLVAPAVLYLESVHGGVRDGGVIALLSAVMFLLVLTRLAGVVDTHRRALGRERGLREASATLVSATSVPEVTSVVRRAVAQLLPPGTRHRVALGLSGLGTSTGTVADLVAAQHSHRGDRAARLQYTRELDPLVAAELSEFEVTLSCPLTTHDRAADDGLAGVLLVAARESALAPLRAPIEVLASQAALALARITLSNEINRRNSEEYFRALVHHTADVILIVNADNSIRYASPSATVVFGLESLAGRILIDLIHPNDQTIARHLLNLVRAAEHRPDVADWSVARPDQSVVQVEVSCRDLSADPTVRGLVITLRDVTNQRRLEQELRHRAYHDSLTGLANRFTFQERVQYAVARAQRSGATVGVLFIDLDDFKVVNDTMGHQTGDEMLVAVAQRLRTTLRPHDTAARLGGDEFAALIEDARDPADVEQVAERIVKALGQPLQLTQQLITSQASVGIATNGEAGSDQDLLRQADLALYVAKGAGKGQWRRYQSALHTAVLQRLELRAALDQAIAEGEFTLEYQPIVSLVGGHAAGFEALVRWNHPTRGLIGPGQFVDVAEESGIIVQVGQWVLENAMRAAAHWPESPGLGAPPYLSVNVSPRQFRTPGFVDRVRQQLAVTGLPPARLMLEITEGLLLRDDEQVWADLSALRELGVRMAIDDFGTGYSSLSYLRQMPIDVLKIDKSFIDTISSSSQQRALVDGIIRLAHTLGLEVIAEGIETSAERDLLTDIGCPLGQGYLYSRPLNYHDALAWMSVQEVPV